MVMDYYGLHTNFKFLRSKLLAPLFPINNMHLFHLCLGRPGRPVWFLGCRASVELKLFDARLYTLVSGPSWRMVKVGNKMDNRKCNEIPEKGRIKEESATNQNAAHSL